MKWNENKTERVLQMSDVILGQLVSPTEQRDAIHVAVIPMLASEMLRPGQRVGIVGDGIAGPSSDVVGIVDPFLLDVVPKHAGFWLCLLPNTVTGMRHHWVHPQFEARGQSLHDLSEKAASEAWLREQCDDLGCDFEDLVGASSRLVYGSYIVSGLNESARDHWYDIEDEFWKHHEIYTGVKTPEENRGGFSCSC